MAASSGIRRVSSVTQIDKRIHEIKAELAAIGDMRPGSLTRQFKDPDNQSGAYYQLSYTLDKKSRTEYVSGDWVAEVRRQVATYKRFKTLTEQWIALSIERCRLNKKGTRKP